MLRRLCKDSVRHKCYLTEFCRLSMGYHDSQIRMWMVSCVASTT